MLCIKLKNHKWTNSYTVSQYFITLALMAVRQEVSKFESSVVVQELEFAMNLALYGLL